MGFFRGKEMTKDFTAGDFVFAMVFSCYRYIEKPELHCLSYFSLWRIMCARD